MKKRILNITAAILILCPLLFGQALTYKVVDTNQKDFYNSSSAITAPLPGAKFFGQDAGYSGYQPSYTDNGNGTITDNVTGLTWQKNMGSKISYAEALIKADTMTLGGYTDWRVPTIKELYSLILFSGQVNGERAIKKFIDEDYFIQPLGDTSIGEREIDAQTWSSTHYKGLTFGRDSTIFGVNFIDGRIKGYPKYRPGSNNTTPNTMYFRLVRGNPAYGTNNFIDNNNGTITDLATGLMWQKADDRNPRDWENALDYAENLTLAGFSDWRLPNAKELQSIVDYSRSPSSTNSPAINNVFSVSTINDPDGNPGHYPYYWTGTTHLDGAVPGSYAVYIAFGKAFGKINGTLLDVHGAGAQRSDPKSGDPSSYPQFMGPQGDARIVFNFVRCVRDASVPNSADNNSEIPIDFYLCQNYPNPFNPSTMIKYSIPGSDYPVRVQLKIFDMLGRQVCTLVDETKSPGIYTAQFDSTKYSLGAGVYFCSLSTGIHSSVMKMVLLK